MSGFYSIKDLERVTGIKAHTIRIWEKRYNIVKPERTESNIRCYTDENLKRLLNISILVKNGYKISRIANLDNKEINDKILDISRLNNNYISQVESLIVSMIELDEFKFEKTLNTMIIKIGFERTVFEIIYPLFEKIGILWQTGSINPAQEHFISNLIRRKMLVAIDDLPAVTSPDSKTIILYLPEWEFHEIGLLLYEYLLRKNGFRVFYLGQSLPLEDLIAVAKIRKPDHIMSVFSSPVPKEDFKKYIHEISRNFPDTTVFISGYITQNISFPLPANVKQFKNAAEFCEEILK